MKKDHIAEANVTINASADKVWKALLDPKAIKEYMFGTTVMTDWKKGSSISWKGEWDGKPYEDRGQVLAIDPMSRLQYSHFSPMSGQSATPDNWHTVTVELSDHGRTTEVHLTQNHNKTEEDEQESSKNWQNMLDGLKQYAERRPNAT